MCPIPSSLKSGTMTNGSTLNYEHWLGHPFSWQKSMVYQGEPVNHPYQIKAVREGIYEFALRRWPYSLDKGFDEILESQVKAKQGRKMDIVEARLLILADVYGVQ